MPASTSTTRRRWLPRPPTCVIVSGTDPTAPTIHVGQIDVAGPIRGDEVTGAVSAVSAVPAVRERLVAIQRDEVAAATAAGDGIVVEGRDITTVVLPDADLKIFVTADPAVRAARRAAQDADLGKPVVDVHPDRDRAARARRQGLQPRRLAAGAGGRRRRRSTPPHLTLDEVIDRVCALVDALPE